MIADLLLAWFRSSFVALVSDFVDEGTEPEDEYDEDEEDEEREEEEERGEKEGGLSGEEEQAAAAVSRLEHGAESLSNRGGHGTGESRCLLTPCDRCLHRESSASSSSNGSGTGCSIRKFPSLVAAECVAVDAFGADGRQKVPVEVAAGSIRTTSAKSRAADILVERHRGSNLVDAGFVVPTEGVGDKTREGSCGRDAVGRCGKGGNKGNGEPRGVEDPPKEQVATIGSSGGPRLQVVQQLSMRAQSKS